jgi:hypothetical protein
MLKISIKFNLDLESKIFLKLSKEIFFKNIILINIFFILLIKLVEYFSDFNLINFN